MARGKENRDLLPAYSPPETAELAKAPPAYELSGIDTKQFNDDPGSISACKRRGMSPVFASHLQHVTRFRKIRIAIDVSGSMGYLVTTPKDSSRNNGVHTEQEPSKTRWQELREQLKLLFDICYEQELIPNGIDVFFIHDRSQARGLKEQNEVKSWEELEKILPKLPGHGTPTLGTVERMFEPWRMAPADTQVLTMIFTDGEPTDGTIWDLKQSLAKKQETFPNSHVTIVLCTDKMSVVNSYNQLDKTAPKLDVMDDYLSEREEIREKQGAKFLFSRDDYVIKLLLGSSVELWDKLDEKKMTFEEVRRFKEYGKKWDWDGKRARKNIEEQQKKKPIWQKIASGFEDIMRADDG